MRVAGGYLDAIIAGETLAATTTGPLLWWQASRLPYKAFAKSGAVPLWCQASRMPHMAISESEATPLWWQASRLPFKVAAYLISAPADVVRSVGQR